MESLLSGDDFWDVDTADFCEFAVFYNIGKFLRLFRVREANLAIELVRFVILRSKLLFG